MNDPPKSGVDPASKKLDEPDNSAVELASKELDFRRDKEWNIFSWCSSILVAITGGAIALQVGQPNKLAFSQRMIVSFAVVVLVGYSVLWLSYNHKMEKQARHSFDEHISKNILSSKSTRLAWFVGHRIALVLLGVAAWLAIWYPS